MFGFGKRCPDAYLTNVLRSVAATIFLTPGLSYTTFRFVPIVSHATVTTTAMAAHHSRYYASQGTSPSPASYTVNVTNTGNVDSDCVVLGFAVGQDPDQPILELFDFARVFIAHGQTVTVTLSVPPQVASYQHGGVMTCLWFYCACACESRGGRVL
jgi:hypothetical protein